MKKLKKLKLSQNADCMSEREMKEVKGGSGTGTYNCSNSAATCNEGTICTYVHNNGLVDIGTCAPFSGGCECATWFSDYKWV